MVVIRATATAMVMAEMAATEVAAPEAAAEAVAAETKVTTMTAVESNNKVMIQRRRQLQQLQRREMTVAIGKTLLGNLLRQQPSVVDTVELT